MKEDQEQSGGALVSRSGGGLIRKSSTLVRRGLDALLQRQASRNASNSGLMGSEEISTVHVEDLKPSEYQHPPFSEERRRQIRLIMASLDEVSEWSFEKWEDGFRRDANPDRELAIWTYIANVYRDYVSARDFTLDQKKDLFLLFFTCSMTRKESVMKDLKPTSISLAEAEKAVEAFYG